MPGAKKTTVAEILSQKGIPFYQLGKVLEQEIENRGQAKTPQNYWNLAQELRQKYGDEIVVKSCWNSIKPVKPIVTFDGIRNQAEVNFLRNVSKKLVLLLVHSSPMTRFQRLKEKYDFYRSYENFCESEKHNLRLGIAQVIALADYVIVNEEYIGRSLEAQTDKFYDFVVRRVVIKGKEVESN